MAQGFLLKYAEIGVKGKNRYKFEDALCNQIRLRLSEIDGEFTVEKESGRVFVQADGSGSMPSKSSTSIPASLR